MIIRPFQWIDAAQVVRLWEACGLVKSQNNPHADLQRKMRVDAELFLIGQRDTEIVATVMAGYDGHRGWINYLAVSPEHRGKGWGREMMEQAERLLRERGCPKINLQVRTSNSAVMSIYRALGFSQDDVFSMGKRLVVDEPGHAAEASPPATGTPHHDVADDFYCAQIIPGRVSVRKVAETERVLAFHHTQPYWPVHIVIIPKKHIPSLAAVPAEDWPIVQEMLTVAGDLCRQMNAEHGGCRLSTNCGDHQSTKHLHFYIHSGSRIRDEQGGAVA